MANLEYEKLYIDMACMQNPEPYTKLRFELFEGTITRFFKCIDRELIFDLKINLA